MSSVLTATGLAMCISLTGNTTPPLDRCESLIGQSSPPCDAWYRCPVMQVSTPDDQESDTAGYSCVAIATYDIYDGTKGTTRRCTRAASIGYLPDGRWAWHFDEAAKDAK